MKESLPGNAIVCERPLNLITCSSVRAKHIHMQNSGEEAHKFNSLHTGDSSNEIAPALEYAYPPWTHTRPGRP